MTAGNLPTPEEALALESAMIGRPCKMLNAHAIVAERGSVLTLLYTCDSETQTQTRVAVFTSEWEYQSAAWSSILNAATRVPA